MVLHVYGTGDWGLSQPLSVGFLNHVCAYFPNFLNMFFFLLSGNHRMPLYFIPVSVSLRLARTLLKRLVSKNKNFNTQFTHASRHPGAENLLQKLKIVMWPHIVEKVAVFGL